MLCSVFFQLRISYSSNRYMSFFSSPNCTVPFPSRPGRLDPSHESNYNYYKSVLVVGYHEARKRMQNMESLPLFACFSTCFYKGTQKIKEIDKGDCT